MKVKRFAQGHQLESDTWSFSLWDSEAGILSPVVHGLCPQPGFL